MFSFIQRVFLFMVLAISALSFVPSGKTYPATPVNILAGTSWIVDGIAFETEDRETYTLTKMAEGAERDYGDVTIVFTDSTFSSHYYPQCGMDCGKHIYGNYVFTADRLIRITVTKIDRYKRCELPSEELNKVYGEYELTETETGWLLTRAV